MTVPYRRAGRIQKSHGTQGEVVVALTDGLSFHDLTGLDVWVVPPPLHVRVHRVLDARQSPKGAIVTLDGVSGLAQAHELVGRWLLTRGDSLPDVGGGVSDVIGYRVTDARRGFLGVVTDVIITGANDVLVVDDGPFGQVLLPVIEQVVRAVDDSAGEIAVELLEGLIEEDSSS